MGNHVYNSQKMAACRIERHPACQDGLEIEDFLCEKRGVSSYAG